MHVVPNHVSWWFTVILFLCYFFQLIKRRPEFSSNFQNEGPGLDWSNIMTFSRSQDLYSFGLLQVGWIYIIMINRSMQLTCTIIGESPQCWIRRMTFGRCYGYAALYSQKILLRFDWITLTMYLHLSLRIKIIMVIDGAVPDQLCWFLNRKRQGLAAVKKVELFA